jgi:Ca2+-binding EF-hand superfamily protein
MQSPQKISEEDLVEIAEELAMRAADKDGMGAAQNIQRRLEKDAGRDGSIPSRAVEALFQDYGLPSIMAVEFCDALDHDGTGCVGAQEIYNRITAHMDAPAPSANNSPARQGIVPPPTPPRSTTSSARGSRGGYAEERTPPARVGREKFGSSEDHTRMRTNIEIIGKAASRKHSNLRKVFWCVYPDRNGMVHRNNVRIFYRNYGLSDQDADVFFDYLDTNNSGTVPYAEFKNHFAKYVDEAHKCDHPAGVEKPPPIWSSAPPEGTILDELDEFMSTVVRQIGEAVRQKHTSVSGAFRYMTMDDDGTVSRQQVRNFFRSYGYTDPHIADKFYDHCADDGRLNAVEFQSHFSMYIQPGHPSCRHLDHQQWIKSDGFDGHTSYMQGFGDAVQRQQAYNGKA